MSFLNVAPDEVAADEADAASGPRFAARVLREEDRVRRDGGATAPPSPPLNVALAAFIALTEPTVAAAAAAAAGPDLNSSDVAAT